MTNISKGIIQTLRSGLGCGVITRLNPVVFSLFLRGGTYLGHMEVPRLRVESELQLPAYTTPHGNAGSLTH